jgi:nucleoside-diphosphate-sugar epimerase
MKLFVTGTEGYLGSLLAPELISAGHDVTGVDTGFYGDHSLYQSRSPRPKTFFKDIRRISADDLEGFDAVVHLAELSNDPLGQLAPNITFDINHKGSVRLAERARAAGVKRFVYMSSCSVYGVGAGDALLTEGSVLNPQTAYAECKSRVERDVRPLATKDFAPTYLRNATAYGASPRMRFDIVLNNLCGLAWTEGSIKMVSDGTPWRPLVHGLDIAQAILAVLAAPVEAIYNESFNVGSTEQNYRVSEIAGIVGEVFPGCEVSFGSSASDNRSYRVDFSKIREHLPSFKCAWDARRGAEQLHALFARIGMTPALFTDRAFTRLKQLEHLIRTGQIDADFFWTVK